MRLFNQLSLSFRILLKPILFETYNRALVNYNKGPQFGVLKYWIKSALAFGFIGSLHFSN